MKIYFVLLISILTLSCRKDEPEIIKLGTNHMEIDSDEAIVSVTGHTLKPKGNTFDATIHFVIYRDKIPDISRVSKLYIYLN